jgi:hypothetical protein
LGTLTAVRARAAPRDESVLGADALLHLLACCAWPVRDNRGIVAIMGGETEQADEIEAALDRARRATDPPSAAVAEALEASVKRSEPPPVVDPRLDAVERLVQAGQWQELCNLLGPDEQARRLPPALVLLYAIGRKETGTTGDETELNYLAIRAVASLCGTGADSHVALVLAKRLLRRPVTLRGRQAPKAPVRVTLVLAAVLVGAAVGWLLGPGGVQLLEIIQASIR